MHQAIMIYMISPHFISNIKRLKDISWCIFQMSTFHRNIIASGKWALNRREYSHASMTFYDYDHRPVWERSHDRWPLIRGQQQPALELAQHVISSTAVKCQSPFLHFTYSSLRELPRFSSLNQTYFYSSLPAESRCFMINATSSVPWSHEASWLYHHESKWFVIYRGHRK